MSGNISMEITREGKEKTKSLLNLPKAARYQMVSFGSEFEKYLKMTAVGGRYVGKYRGGARRTSKLRRSIRHTIKKSGELTKLEIGSYGTDYARILEKGGIIRAKNKYIGKRKQSGPWLFIPIKKGSKTTFRLKKSVKIPRFAWLEKSWRDRKGKLDNMMNKKTLLRVAKRLN